MKLLHESWRAYINEVKLHQIDYFSKPMRKMIDRYASPDRRFTWMAEPMLFRNMSPRGKELMKKAWLKDFVKHMNEIISDEMAGGEKSEAQARLWIMKMAQRNERLAADIVDGADEASEYWDDIRDFFSPDYKKFIDVEYRNIMNVSSLEMLQDIMKQARQREEERRAEKGFPDVMEGMEFYKGDVVRDETGKPITIRGKLRLAPDHDGWTIAVFKNFAAACEFSAGSWCTKHQKNTFDRYNKPEDPLFFFQDADGNMFQFHYGEMEFLDGNNKFVSEEVFIMLHNMLKQTEAIKKYPVINNYDYVLLGNPEMFAKAYIEMEDTEVVSFANYLLRDDIPRGDNTIEILKFLATDENPEVRLLVAHNSSTPTDILQGLAEDEDHRVSFYAKDALSDPYRQHVTGVDLDDDVF
jgi:hypothetical protein